MDARHGRAVALLCLTILALVGLRLAALASEADSATRDALVSTFGTTESVELPGLQEAP